MKLRIQGNSIRLRLSQSDVKAFAETGRVVEKIAFGPAGNNALEYILERGNVAEPAATFAAHQITVSIPAAMGMAWATTDQVGMEHGMDLGDGQLLSILVEKDFKCLTERTGEDESDNFPNPNLAC